MTTAAETLGLVVLQLLEYTGCIPCVTPMMWRMCISVCGPAGLLSAQHSDPGRLSNQSSCSALHTSCHVAPTRCVLAGTIARHTNHQQTTTRARDAGGNINDVPIVYLRLRSTVDQGELPQRQKDTRTRVFAIRLLHSSP